MPDASGDSWDGILSPEEHILWQGRPDGALDFSSFWSWQTVFALGFTGFAVSWIIFAFSITAGMQDNLGRAVGMIFPLFGLPFLLIGLFLLFGRFWDEAWQRRASHYTLTNRAAYVGLQNRSTRRLDRYEIGPDTRLTLEDGAPGTVWFASQINEMPRRAPRIGRSRSRIGGVTQTRQHIGFERIADARSVYALMRKVQIDRADPQKGGFDA